MNFYRWFFRDDTPHWKRAATTFLLVATVAVLVGLVVWVASQA